MSGSGGEGRDDRKLNNWVRRVGVISEISVRDVIWILLFQSNSKTIVAKQY